MALRDWLRPPRHLVALFVLLTLVPSLLLIAFGWRLLRQDLGTLVRYHQVQHAVLES